MKTHWLIVLLLLIITAGCSKAIDPEQAAREEAQNAKVRAAVARQKKGNISKPDDLEGTVAPAKDKDAADRADDGENAEKGDDADKGENEAKGDNDKDGTDQQPQTSAKPDVAQDIECGDCCGQSGKQSRVGLFHVRGMRLVS